MRFSREPAWQQPLQRHRYNYNQPHSPGATNIRSAIDSLSRALHLLISTDMAQEFRSLLQRAQHEIISTDPSRLECSPTDVLKTLHQKAGPFAQILCSEYGDFHTQLLDAFVRRYVKKEPRTPHDWVMTRRGCGNPTCSHCQKLDTFLISPTQMTARFSLPQASRTHLEQRIKPRHQMECDFIMGTEKHHTPFTLVITKTTKEYQREHASWTERAKSAKERIRSICSEATLRQFLGPRFDEITQLQAVTLRRLPDGTELEPEVVRQSTMPLTVIHNPPVTTQPTTAADQRSDVGHSSMLTTEGSMKRKDPPADSEENSRPTKRAAPVSVIDLCNSP